MRRSDFCRVIGPSFFRPPAYRLLWRNPGRSPWVRHADFVTIPSPIRQPLRRILGFAAESQLTRGRRLTALHLHSKRSRTYDFHQTSPHGLTAVAVPSAKTWFPDPRSCLFGVGFPPSGPRVRSFTSGLRVMPGALFRAGTRLEKESAAAPAFGLLGAWRGSRAAWGAALKYFARTKGQLGSWSKLLGEWLWAARELP